ncbi:MAG: hypothetical protein IJQ59_07135 [Bacteroidaceae bacterium]|nr:hypothetical protein [Bacteroidaceae bacterium]
MKKNYIQPALVTALVAECQPIATSPYVLDSSVDNQLDQEDILSKRRGSWDIWEDEDEE